MSGLKRVSSNVESRKNNAYSLQLSRWFLLSIGAWPQTRTSTIVERLSAIVLIPVCSVVVAIITVPCLLYMLFEAQDIQSKLNATGPLLHRIMGSVNYWTLLNRSGDIRNCIRHMEADWRLVRRAGDRELMLQHAKFGRFIAVMCAVFMQGGAFLFNIAKAMKTVTVVIDNETVTMYPMTCPSYQKFIDARFSPANEIMLVVQFMSTYITSASTVCICSLAAVFAMHACGQLNVLNMWLNELTENHDEEEPAEKKLATVVEHHLSVLRYLHLILEIRIQSAQVHIFNVA